eukprot:CAMPEP_0171456244 /NCGR_PEP_ID=MMETSP0945-20130129/2807_1 /TAXON_ID=109269 /ORGANISM="Vaucheria litorea, Strain CCMP2940" /LENGTH=349 /DNA_ID=CAMNT_0011981627 /DNA_START=187 /DNA_END=1236 /DNA_ORIENTATION=+
MYHSDAYVHDSSWNSFQSVIHVSLPITKNEHITYLIELEDEGKALSNKNVFDFNSVTTKIGTDRERNVEIVVIFSVDGEKPLSAIIKHFNNAGNITCFMMQRVFETNGDESFVIYPMPSSALKTQPSRHLAAAQNTVLIDVQADFEYIEFHGGDCNASFEHIQEVIAMVNIQYLRDLGFSLTISNIFCDMDGSTYPSAITDVNTLLQYVSNNWKTVLEDPLNDTRANADLTHLFTGKNLLGDGSSGIVGLAYTGTACARTEFSCGLSMSDFHLFISPDDSPNTNLVFSANNSAHEIGHNFNAMHCTDNCPTTMNPAILGVTQFGALAIQEITTYKSQVSCFCDSNVCDN